MAGVYVHIPFCKSRCKYCDFFSTTMLEKRDEYVQAVVTEMQQRRDYLRGGAVHTIYFGGGTPSMLTVGQVGTILEGIRANFAVDRDAEITLEANPSDVTEEKLRGWRELGVNRLSMGVQSFNDELLRKIGRRHDARQAVNAVREALQAGFDNISIDLIYGLPSQTMEDWKRDVSQALELNIQHVSAYCLSYEEGTEMTRQLQAKEIEAVDDETENAMYDYLVEALAAHGIERYEVSNFAKRGYESQHNSSYWNGTPYLGLGAGAHSYDGESRQWNAKTLSYSPCLGGELGPEFEKLTDVERYNEYVMLSLRTREGLDMTKVPRSMHEVCEGVIKRCTENGLLRRDGDRVVATNEGIHILNRIIEDLMI